MSGQPPYYSNKDEMQVAIDSYFDSIEVYNLEHPKKPKPPTVTGLALHLGFCSRQSLIDYENRGEFFDTMKRAKLRIEQFNEERLYGDGQVTGTIFNLKNNFSWKDKIETDNTNNNYNQNFNEPDKEKLKEINDFLNGLVES